MGFKVNKDKFTQEKGQFAQLPESSTIWECGLIVSLANPCP